MKQRATLFNRIPGSENTRIIACCAQGLLLNLVVGCATPPTPAEPTPVYSEDLPKDAEPVSVERVSIDSPEPTLVTPTGSKQDVAPTDGDSSKGSTEAEATPSDPAKASEPAVEPASEAKTSKNEPVASPAPQK